MHFTCEKKTNINNNNGKKWSEEEKVSGINPRHTEIDDVLLDLIQRFDETDSERKKNLKRKT